MALKWIASLSLLLISIETFALMAQPTRVVLYRRGESIGGEEFIVPDEKIVDYLATLPRPSEPLKGIPYNCSVKSRVIKPSVYSVGGTQSSWTTIRTVYELKDCIAGQ